MTIRTRYADSDRDDVIRLATEFIAVLDDIVGAMDERNVGQREKEEFLMISCLLKLEIGRV